MAAHTTAGVAPLKWRRIQLRESDIKTAIEAMQINLEEIWYV